MRPRGRATVGQISLLVHVEAVESLGEAVDRSGDSDGPIRDGLDDLQVARDVLHVNVVWRQANDRHHLLIEPIRRDQCDYINSAATWRIIVEQRGILARRIQVRFSPR